MAREVLSESIVGLMTFLGSGTCDLLERMHGWTPCGQTPLLPTSAFSEFYLEQMFKEGTR
jgi:hypothetical protein